MAKIDLGFGKRPFEVDDRKVEESRQKLSFYTSPQPEGSDG